MPTTAEMLAALLSDKTGSLTGIGLLITLNVIIQLGFTLFLLHQGLRQND